MTANSASSSGQLKLYINGVLVDTENYSVSSSSQGLTNTNHEIAIGAFDDTASRNFNGEVSDFRLWNDVRTQSEISSNLNQAISTDSNPYALTFDPSYVFAPNQGIRGFFGIRYVLNYFNR